MYKYYNKEFKNLIEELQISAEEVGEYLWEMPMFEEYFDDLNSSLASLKTTLEEDFAESAATAAGLPVGEKAKEMYGIPEKVQLIDETMEMITDYKTWLNARFINL